MQEINILVLSAGKRVELIECFKKASKDLKIESKIIAVDISELAPALYFANKSYIIPRIGEEGYIEEIIKICNAENIKLIVPTIDTELRILSENKEKIEKATKAKILISSNKVISICRDKRNTQLFFENNNFGVPRLITDDDIKENKMKFPLFIKPINGSSSINTFKIKNMKELLFFKEYIKDPMIQEMVEGEEYTVDAFLDFNGNVITIVPRKRMAIRGGEILKGKIEKDRTIIEDVKKVLEELKPIGQITIQLIKTNDGIKYIEINPRFGGGAPMSIFAGADSCKNLYRLLMGEKLEYNENYEDNVVVLRFDDSIRLNENMERI